MGEMTQHSGELALPFTINIRDPPPLLQWSRRAGSALVWELLSQSPRMTNSAITQINIMGLGLAHPNICHMFDLLEYVKGLFLYVGTA